MPVGHSGEAGARLAGSLRSFIEELGGSDLGHLVARGYGVALQA
jgi:hypothetical protein